ncbi:MAG TPA: penicillin-insensitive murein endopeptidase [Solirubrobacterales bacterium]|nr:penicillin-insensitive murein endopeptidase [Solirubrobacterales bacterium]
MRSDRPTPTRARRRRLVAALALVAAGASAAVAGATLGAEERGMAQPAAVDVPRSGIAERERDRREPRIEWRHSRAVGLPHAGRLERGVKLPAAGRNYFTWDPIQRESPNRGWRRWGTDRLVRTVLRVLRELAAAHPRAPRIGIGDISRPRGGDFGPRYGLPGHASHQSGLDVDLYYPRHDRRERAPLSVDQVDLRLSQDLVDRFVRAGAEKVFVGPATGLKGPPAVVAALVHHDNHLHVRLPG